MIRKCVICDKEECLKNIRLNCDTEECNVEEYLKWMILIMMCAREKSVILKCARLKSDTEECDTGRV